jgi:hypothetical protein
MFKVDSIVRHKKTVRVSNVIKYDYCRINHHIDCLILLLLNFKV